MTADPLIHCPRCQNVLGELRGGVLTSRSRGRVIVAVPVSIQCEKCSTVWTPPDTGDLVALSRLIGRRAAPTADVR